MLLTYGLWLLKGKKRNSEEEKNDIKNNFHLLAIKVAKQQVYDRIEDEFLPNNLLGILKNCKESHYRDDSRWILHYERTILKDNHMIHNSFKIM
jgi:hypothetical protein